MRRTDFPVPTFLPLRFLLLFPTMSSSSSSPACLRFLPDSMVTPVGAGEDSMGVSAARMSASPSASGGEDLKERDGVVRREDEASLSACACISASGVLFSDIFGAVFVVVGLK